MILHGEDRNLGHGIGGEAGKGVDDELQRCLPLKKRHPTCARCRNHGLILDLKGHKRTCEYRDCRCSRCILVSQRRIVMAKQVALSREQVRQQRQDRDTAEQMPGSQRFYRDVPPPSEPPVIDLTSEEPCTEEMVHPVVQPSPDSTNNIRYCGSPYSPWDSSQTNCSQSTLMTSSPQPGFGQASHYYPTSFPSSQINETHRSGLAFAANHLGRPVKPRPIVPLVPYQSSGLLGTNLSDRIGGAVPSVNSLSSQGTFGQASQYYPTSLHTSRVDEMHRSRVSLTTNHFVQPVIPSPGASHEPSGYFSNRMAAPSANFSPSQVSQYYPTSFVSSQVDEKYRCQVSLTANYTNRPVLPSSVVPLQSIGAVSAYRDNYVSAKPQLNSSANAYISAADTVQTTCYWNVTDEVHRHRQEYSYASSSRVAPFEEQVASMSSLPTSVVTTQLTFISPNQNSLSSATSTPYAFQTADEPPFFSQIADTYQDDELRFRSQVASTLQGLPSIYSDGPSFEPQVASTSQQTQFMTSARSNDTSYLSKTATNLEQPTGASSFKCDEPSYKSRRPYPLKITIPSLPLNQANGIDDHSPIDPSPTFSPSTLSLLDKVTLPSSDIQSPGFFTSSLPSFNYPSPTLPTQSSPVFSYPAPYTNPSQHARASPFHYFPDSPLPVIPTSQSTSNFTEQVRIPPTFDEDFDEDQEDGDIDVCSLDHYQDYAYQ